MPTRSAAVKRLKGAGDKATAGAVAELRRPTQAAWAVNLLVREQGELVAELLELGVSMREAQSSLDADTLRELTRERRRLVARVAGAAATAVADEGQKLSEASRRQVEDTLQAAVVDAELAEVVRSGLLVQPLSSTGMASLADVQAIPGAARLELVRGVGWREGVPPPRPDPRETGADDSDAASEREAARAEAERVAEERRRVRERTRLQKVRETEQRAVRSSDSEVARLEQDVATARSRLARAESDLERATAKQQDVRARLRRRGGARRAVLSRTQPSAHVGVLAPARTTLAGRAVAGGEGDGEGEPVEAGRVGHAGALAGREDLRQRLEGYVEPLAAGRVPRAGGRVDEAEPSGVAGVGDVPRPAGHPGHHVGLDRAHGVATVVTSAQVWGSWVASQASTAPGPDVRPTAAPRSSSGSTAGRAAPRVSTSQTTSVGSAVTSTRVGAGLWSSTDRVTARTRPPHVLGRLLEPAGAGGLVLAGRTRRPRRRTPSR